MKKLASVLLLLLVVVPLAVFLAASSLPLSIFTGQLQKQFDVTPLSGSRLINGRGLVSSSTGIDILNWRWCPGEGIGGFCFQQTGVKGYYRGVFRVGAGYYELAEISFSGLHPQFIGISGLDGPASLAGELNSLRWGWQDGCVHHGLATARGALSLTGARQGTIELEGDGSSGVQLRGDIINGTLDLRGNRISGRLSLELPGVSGGLRNSGEINVARRISCQPGTSTR